MSRVKLSLVGGGHGASGLNPREVYIGATVPIFSHSFKILDADEYTMRYMAENSSIWQYR